MPNAWCVIQQAALKTAEDLGDSGPQKGDFIKPNFSKRPLWGPVP